MRILKYFDVPRAYEPPALVAEGEHAISWAHSTIDGERVTLTMKTSTGGESLSVALTGEEFDALVASVTKTRERAAKQWARDRRLNDPLARK